MAGIILSNRLKAMQDAAANFGDSIQGIREAQRQAARQADQDKMLKDKFTQEQKLGDFQLAAAKRKEEEDAAQGLAKQEAQGYADDIAGFGTAVPDNAIGLPGMQTMQSPRPVMDQTADNLKDRLRASMDNSFAKSQGKVSALTAADIAAQRKTDAEKKSLNLQEFNLGLDKTKAEIESTKAGTESKSMDAKKTGMEIKKMQTEIDNLAKGGLDPEKSAAIEQKLMTTYLNQNKGFQDVHDAYSRVMASAKDPSPAGDLALIFNYMKMLDPGSTVREGEFANAESAGSIPQSVWNKYNKVVSGERLKETRSDFLKQSANLYGAAYKNYERTQGTFTKLANNYRVNPENVVIPLESAGVGDAARANASPEKTGGVRSFKSAREAMASGLPAGTVVTINGMEAEL
jgi:hypothetical protein